MNADIPPVEIAMVAMIELVYGIGYNALVAVLFRHRLMHVSLSVVIGVLGTLLIPALVWFNRPMPFWQSGLLLLLCFAVSGTPMVIGSMSRTVAKDDKKRRRIGNTAAKIRDGIVLDMHTLAADIADMSKEERLTVSHLPHIVNRIHGLIGELKSL